MFADGESQEDIRIYFAQTCFRGERHLELERLYFETYFPLDERIPRLRRLADGEVTHVTDLYTEKELKTSAAYNLLRTRVQAGNALNVRLDGSNGSGIG